MEENKKVHGNRKKPLVDNIVVDHRKYKGKKPQKTEYPVDLTENYEELPEDVISVTEGTGSYVIEARDPYHHCYIVGPNLPVTMQGAYTTYTQAKNALDMWLSKGK